MSPTPKADKAFQELLRQLTIMAAEEAAGIRANGFDKKPKAAKDTHDEWTDCTSTKYWVHRWTAACRSGCAIHAPSDHSMRDFPQHMRDDKSFLIERICGHGIGHPDPDSLAWFERNGDDSMGVHGCDGCCAGAYPVKASTKKASNIGSGWGTRSYDYCELMYNPYHSEWDCMFCNPLGLTRDDIH